MSLQHFFKPNGTQKELIWSIIFRNGFANGRRWELPTLFSHTDATTGADVVSTVQRLYPANNNIKDTIRGAIRGLVEEGKLKNCGVSGHPIYTTAEQGITSGVSTRVETGVDRELDVDILSDDGEDSKPLTFEGVSYELDGDGVAVYDDDGDHVGNWDGEKIDFLNSGWKMSHEEKVKELDEEQEDIRPSSKRACEAEEDERARVESLNSFHENQCATDLGADMGAAVLGDDILGFLKSIKLEMWEGTLREMGLTDLSFLKYITEEDLKEIGMPKLHIRCILDKI